ncbi:hypothetical protein IV203_027360 [Nitzschia inconspicua]|uniref:Uncharacterized protein n=1 Tax=Nitzschia inconspicua TaxID=303405 RepID=A0A9K3Q600_9STRA|nr:hypothetical protein IV203_021295 [Nitzschia inconspicua]KAG7347601.1 hypothetical protein IV203_016306 [Nitzschia inconspicua]KAG7358934.1 hypothetical protein IV203_015523 [Nitzschia inconspicua]KAG7369614.1 hypothetical protein IV203_027360 [Nitzschia inconspicua]
MSSNSIARQNNNGSLPCGFIDEAVASLTSQGIEATRHTIYNHEKKLRRKSIPSEHPAPSTVRLQVRLANPNNTPAKVTSPSATTNQGGRPRGTVLSRVHRGNPKGCAGHPKTSTTYKPEYYLPSTITDELQPLPLPPPPPPAAAAIFDNDNGNDSAE